MNRNETERAIWRELNARCGADDLGAIAAELWAELSLCLKLAQGTKRRPYGVLITSAPPPSTLGRLLTCSIDPEEVRHAAEGTSILVGRWPGAPLHLLQLRVPLHTDEDCAALATRAGGLLLLSDAAGRLRVVCPRSVLHIDGGELWTRPHLDEVIDALRGAAPQADVATLGSLARLACSHVSPARIGATLVYQAATGDEEAACFGGVAIDRLDLNVNEPAHLSGILHQLEHRDGALVFGRTGALRRCGVILVPSSAALEAVGSVPGGTRHHSAAWHSYDRPDVLCFVVSKAGRVSVYSRGQEVLAREGAAASGRRAE